MMRGKVAADLVMERVSPPWTVKGSSPSTLRLMAWSGRVGWTVMTLVSATMTERLVRTCGEIGVMTRTGLFGMMMGPPAASE